MASIRDLFVTIGFDIDEKPLQQIDRNIRNVQNGARRLSFLFAGAAASIGIFLKQAGDFEQIEIAFETMLGSAEKAKILLDGLKEDARRTPFTLPGILENAKLLLAMGIEAENVRGSIETLGNIAAGVGRDKLPRLALALGQVRAATKLRGQEVRQFTEAGVPILDELSRVLGKPVRDMQKLISQGKVSFDDVNQALINLTTGSGRFANLMERQSTTFLGILSNIKDFIIINAIAIGKELLPQAKAVANEFLRMLEVNRQIIKTRAVKFFKELAITIGILFKSFKAILEGIINVTDALGGLGIVIRNLTLLMLGFISLQIISGIGATTQAVFGLISAMRTLGGVALITQAKIIAMPLIIGAAVIALGLIMEDIIAFFRGKDSITALLIEAFEKKFPEAFGITRDILFTIRDTIGVIVDETKLAVGFLNEFLGFGAISNIISGFSPAPATGGGNTTNQVSVSAPITVDVSGTGLSAEAAAFAVETGVKDALNTTLRTANNALRPRVEQ